MPRELTFPGLALGLVLASQVAVAYTCPGSPTDYRTDCTPEGTTGESCLRPVPGSGCCFAGLGICSAGACYVPAGSTQTACDDGNQCTIDVCHTGGGSLAPVCTYPLGPDAADCDLDDNLCTVDKCDHGRCTHAAPDVSCAQCQACNHDSGQCENVPNPDMQACDDGRDCTTGDVCVNGTCRGTGVQAKNYVCVDGNPCEPGRCNGTDGECHNRMRTADFTHCDPEGPPSFQTRSDPFGSSPAP